MLAQVEPLHAGIPFADDALFDTFEADEPRSGTQTIERAVALVRQIAMSQFIGCRLSGLSEACGLRKSTAHRILAGLIREGLVIQRPGDRRYVLGPLLFELGISATPERLELQHAARVKLGEIARKTSSVAMLFFRSGDDFVCSARVAETRVTARSLAVLPGTRRPLAYAAGGVAILMALPRAEAMSILRRNLERLSLYTETPPADVIRMVRRCHREGIATCEGDIVRGINAVGMALCNSTGEPFGSISLAAPEQDLTMDRLDDYRAVLEDATKFLWAHKPQQSFRKLVCTSLKAA